ncbi:hypothetical protein L1887_14228 [Cichorium endivia]|nr:hypothetical protein L1887_14228 [Cichorium endivia]
MMAKDVVKDAGEVNLGHHSEKSCGEKSGYENGGDGVGEKKEGEMLPHEISGIAHTLRSAVRNPNKEDEDAGGEDEEVDGEDEDAISIIQKRFSCSRVPIGVGCSCNVEDRSSPLLN